MKKIFTTLAATTLFAACACCVYAQGGAAGAQEVRTRHIDELSMSDPFILADPATQTYYMTGTGGRLYKSKDLRMWDGPYTIVDAPTDGWWGERPQIWAAELHYYNGKYYNFLTFTNNNVTIEKVPRRYDIPRRASTILVADKPEGPYRPADKNVLYLPDTWATLDGTLWVEDGVPYLVFCHEWLQIVDGTMDIVRLTPDLGASTGTITTLWRASEGPWVKEMNSIGEITFGKKLPGWVTDGPCLFRTQTGRLGMLWSAWGSNRYAQGVAYSESGTIFGPWTHEPEALNGNNAGHSMLFRTFEGKLLMSVHYQSLDPANPGPRKPMLLEMDDSGDKLRIVGRYNP